MRARLACYHSQAKQVCALVLRNTAVGCASSDSRETLRLGQKPVLKECFSLLSLFLKTTSTTQVLFSKKLSKCHWGPGSAACADADGRRHSRRSSPEPKATRRSLLEEKTKRSSFIARKKMGSGSIAVVETCVSAEQGDRPGAYGRAGGAYGVGCARPASLRPCKKNTSHVS